MREHLYWVIFAFVLFVLFPLGSASPNSFLFPFLGCFAYPITVGSLVTLYKKCSQLRVKFYFVLETQKLWLYKDGTWYQISASVDLSNYYTKTEVNELIPEVPTNLSDFIDDLGTNI